MDLSYLGFLRFQTTMLMMTKIPRTRAPPTAEPITIPLLFPLVLFSLSPGPLLMAELEDTAVMMAWSGQKMTFKYVPHYAIINPKNLPWEVISDNSIHFLFNGNMTFPQMGELTQTYLWRFHFCTSGLVWDSCWWCCLGR